MRPCCIRTALLLWFVPLAAPCAERLEARFAIQHWTTEHGLPQSTVQCLLRTRDGFLWVGTQAGLARFDGHRWRVWDRQNTPEFRSDSITCLAEAPDETLWIGTSRGLVKKVGARLSWLKTWDDSIAQTGALVTALALRADGTVLIGSDLGLKEFDHGQWKYHANQPGVPTGGHCHVFSLATDTAGRLLVSVAGGLFKETEDGSFARLVSGDNAATDDARFLQVGRTGTVWWIDSNGLNEWSAGQHRVLRPDGVNSLTLERCLAMDADGALWAASPSIGLVHYQNGRFAHFDSEGATFPSDIRVMLSDPSDGSLWVGTRWHGLIRLSPRAIIGHTAKDGLPHSEVWTLSAGPDGTVWAGTTQGLAQWDGARWVSGLVSTSDAYPAGAPNGVSCVLTDRSGRVWFAGDAFGMAASGSPQFRPGQHRSATAVPSPHEASAPIREVHSLYQSRDGALWVGVPGGALHRPPEPPIPDEITTNDAPHWRLLAGEHDLAGYAALGMLEDSLGGLWFGSTAGRLTRREAGRFRAFDARDGLPPGPVGPVFAEPDGTVWFGSTHGLIRWKENRFRTVATTNGLAENIVLSVQPDDFGWFWFNGHRGLHRARRADLHAVADGRQQWLHVITYTEADGLPSTEGNGGTLPNSCRTPDGRLWFPTSKGIAVADPATLQENRVPPQVLIEEVIVDGDRFDSSVIPRGLSLAAGRARTLAVRFTAPEFSHPRAVRFAYRLSEQDSDWNYLEPTADRVAQYTNLAPGDHRFEVRAANRDGNWSDPVGFAFHLTPHLWQTWFFYVACGLGVIAGGLVLHQVRLRRRLVVERFERELALARQRERIARDLHDELGAGLTRLALLARRMPHGNGNGAFTETVTSTARELTASLGEVVWATNPQHDTLDQLAAYLREYAARFLADAGLDAHLDFPETVDARPVSADVRRELFLVLKESLNNAAKHAHARTVTVRFDVNHTLGIMLEISDDGIGVPDSTVLPESPPHSGNGLRHLRQRAAETGGECVIESAPGRGTRIRMRSPLCAKQGK